MEEAVGRDNSGKGESFVCKGMKLQTDWWRDPGWFKPDKTQLLLIREEQKMTSDREISLAQSKLDIGWDMFPLMRHEMAKWIELLYTWESMKIPETRGNLLAIEVDSLWWS